MKSYALSEKSGGGTLKETVLWTNPNPNNDFGGQSVTLSEPYTSFDLIYCKYKANTTSAVTYMAYFRESDLVGADGNTANSFIACFAMYNAGNWARRIYQTSNTALYVTNCSPVGAAGTKNNYTIPLEIGGIKL